MLHHPIRGEDGAVNPEIKAESTAGDDDECDTDSRGDDSRGRVLDIPPIQPIVGADVSLNGRAVRQVINTNSNIRGHVVIDKLHLGLSFDALACRPWLPL